MDKPWKLTKQELAEVDARDQSRYVAQVAKKRAYIEAGGVILNPDALEDMYEALKIAIGVFVALDTTASREVADILRQARAKTEES